MTVRLTSIAGEGDSRVHVSGDRAGVRVTVDPPGRGAPCGYMPDSASTLLTRDAMRELRDALSAMLGEESVEKCMCGLPATARGIGDDGLERCDGCGCH